MSLLRLYKAIVSQSEDVCKIWMYVDVRGVVSLYGPLLVLAVYIILPQNHLEGELREWDGVAAVREEAFPAVAHTVASSQNEPGI